MTWSVVKIGSLCQRVGKADPRRSPDVPFRYIDISGIDRELKRILTTAEILGANAPSRARQVVKAHDVLVSTVRPNLNAVATVPDELDGQIASTGFCVLRGRKDILDPQFLFFFTRTEQFINALLQRVRGASYPAVTDRNIFDTSIPWPTNSEQRRIVKILEQADALRKKRTEADAKAARILSALFHKMFGDPAANPKAWPIVALGEVLADTRNGLYKPLSCYGRGISILKMFNIRDGELDLNRVDVIDVDDAECKAYEVVPGDILLNRVNTPELVGKCAVVTDSLGKAVFESKNIRIRLDPSKAHCEYVARYLNSPFGHASLRSGVKHAIGMATVNNSDLRRVRMPLPPMPIQEAWAKAAQSCRAIRETQAASRRVLDGLFSVLLHRAFSGDLTAKWREAHMKELLAEMEQQAKALTAKPSDDVVTVRANRNAGHDMFNKAALATYIVVKCHSPQYPFGRVKLAKLFYLAQRRAEMTLTESFSRRAAGPLDDSIHKFLNLAKKKGWVKLLPAQGKLKPVAPGDDPQPAMDQVQQRWSAAIGVIDELLETMKKWRTDTLERWATVEPVAQELVAQGQPLTANTVLSALANVPEWKAKLDREAFSEDKVAATIDGLRKFGFLPQGS